MTPAPRRRRATEQLHVRLPNGLEATGEGSIAILCVAALAALGLVLAFLTIHG